MFRYLSSLAERKIKTNLVNVMFFVASLCWKSISKAERLLFSCSVDNITSVS